MKKTVRTIILFILLFGAFLAQALGAGSSPAYVFSDQELDNLLAPIALYPDPLLAVMLPASTYPAEIADARRGELPGRDWRAARRVHPLRSRRRPIRWNSGPP